MNIFRSFDRQVVPCYLTMWLAGGAISLHSQPTLSLFRLALHLCIAAWPRRSASSQIRFGALLCCSLMHIFICLRLVEAKPFEQTLFGRTHATPEAVVFPMFAKVPQLIQQDVPNAAFLAKVGTILGCTLVGQPLTDSPEEVVKSMSWLSYQPQYYSSRSIDFSFGFLCATYYSPLQN